MDEKIAFAFGMLFGVFMLIKPNFVLFRPTVKSRWLVNLIGEENWQYLIRIVGILLAVFSGIFLYIEFTT